MTHDSSDSPFVQIPITMGYTVLVSPEDSDLIQYKWYAFRQSNTCYAGTTMPQGTVRMHRLILERILERPLVKGELVDHRDTNGLNNRRDNLRLATSLQNQFNRGTPKHNTSGYKGVMRGGSKWYARININGKKKFLGSFSDIKDAARAYNQAALEQRGEFANLNVIED